MKYKVKVSGYVEVMREASFVIYADSTDSEDYIAKKAEDKFFNYINNQTKGTPAGNVHIEEIELIGTSKEK